MLGDQCPPRLWKSHGSAVPHISFVFDSFLSLCLEVNSNPSDATTIQFLWWYSSMSNFFIRNLLVDWFITSTSQHSNPHTQICCSTTPMLYHYATAAVEYRSTTPMLYYYDTAAVEYPRTTPMVDHYATAAVEYRSTTPMLYHYATAAVEYRWLIKIYNNFGFKTVTLNASVAS